MKKKEVILVKKIGVDVAVVIAPISIDKSL